VIEFLSEIIQADPAMRDDGDVRAASHTESRLSAASASPRLLIPIVTSTMSTTRIPAFSHLT
jgi:hypothetical protein